MLGSVQSRQETSTNAFRTVVSPEITDIFLKAAAKTGTEIAFVEIPAQRGECIEGKSVLEVEPEQKELLVEIMWETKQQAQDFWIAFDNEWRKAHC
jgi:iron only hydrogenase large subunit-like protein